MESKLLWLLFTNDTIMVENTMIKLDSIVLMSEMPCERSELKIRMRKIYIMIFCTLEENGPFRMRMNGKEPKVVTHMRVSVSVCDRMEIE